MVAADRAADVEDDGLAGRDDAVGRPVVRRRRIRPGPDDGEFGVVVALGDQPLVDLARDVRLGPPDQPAGGDLGDDSVGGVGGLGQEGDLVVVLDDAQAAEDRRRELEACARQPFLEAEQVTRGQVVRDRDATSVSPASPTASRTIPATSSWASPPSSHGTTGRNPPAAAAHERAGVASRRGATRASSPRVGMTSIVSRSSDDAG